MAKLVTNEPLLTGSRYINEAATLQKLYVGVEPRMELTHRMPVDNGSFATSSAQELYRLVRGDRIDNLAAELLGDSRLWWLLVDFNPLVITDPHHLTPGRVITIPPISLVERL